MVGKNNSVQMHFALPPPICSIVAMSQTMSLPCFFRVDIYFLVNAECAFFDKIIILLSRVFLT
jgi:hypothetical protein